MSQERGITREQSIGEVVSKTFDLFRHDFVKYVILFAVVEAVVGLLTTLVQRTYVLPALPANPTSQQVLNWLPGFFGALVPLVLLSALVGLVFYPLAIGTSINMASEEIQNGRSDLGASFRFTASKLPNIWLLSILVGIIVGLGLFALIVPGIILAIMFSLTLPVLLIEKAGVLDSLGRSRKLVGNRWLKTFAAIIIIGIVVVIAGIIVGVIAGPFGTASGVLSSILSAFYLPLFPIFLTVYYYSNFARITPPAASPTLTLGGAREGTKFCPRCGAQLVSTTAFCPRCGAPQPT